ncbi:heavy metal translocating P-type ATPase [Porphyromonas endodontalis]|jgi:copper-exporting ATPase|uniref:heavy metal translocating P-type ATPase n=1 Tax=Porphyromonas endodontalis TaxID=28124 RepID=UPI0028E36405|nr:heavy metal translocating P-type ATPase [Porphyromonas endodontalis]
MQPNERYFPVVGMRCAACAEKVEQAVAHAVGVESAAVLYTERILHVRYRPTETSPEALAKVVEGVGFELILADTEYELAEQHRKALLEDAKRMRRNLIGAWVATLLMMLLMLLPFPHFVHQLGMALAAASVYFFFAADYHRAALRQIVHGVFSMDTLVSLSTTVSFVSGVLALLGGWGIFTDAHIYFDATVMIPAFVLLGKWLEQRATQRTGDAVAALVESRPRWALQMRDGVATEVPVETLKVGDRIRVRAGEAIPVDGVLLKGTTSVDEQLISGEPLPVEKVVGSSVFAGTLNREGAFTMEATSVGRDTILGTIIETVRHTQTDKPPIRRIADRIAAIFVPVVMGLSLLTLLLWLLLGDPLDAWRWGMRCAISVLVIACPCALGLATPTALTVMVGETARRHILIRKAAAMEVLPRVTHVFLDKTGTITSGHPEVVEETWADGVSPKELMPLFVAMEQQSTHPLAAAIVAHAALPEDLVLSSLDSVETFVGKGVEAYSEGGCYRIGNAAFVGATPHPEAEGSEVFFSREGQVVARLLVADRVTEESREAVADLRKRGIEVVLLTGDNHGAAQTAAQAAGIEEWHAALLPHEKLEIVAKARAKGAVVAMVGDGINDSEALGEADVSLAFASGSDIAVSVADITLAQNDLRLLPQAIEIAKRSLRTIHANFFWALLYNFIAIPLAAGALYSTWGILLSPAISGAAMAFSSLSVVTNSLLLKRRLRREK